MAYKHNIPQPADELRFSQADILNNFQAIETVFEKNHGGFGTNIEGKHKFVQMNIQGAVGTSVGDQVVLGVQLGAFSGIPELYFRGENNGPVRNITEGLNNTTAIGPGWYRTASGTLVKWGIVNVPAAAATYNSAFIVAANIPPFATTPSMFISPIDPTPQLGIEINLVNLTGNVNNLNFSFVTTVTPAGYVANILAIGT